MKKPADRVVLVTGASKGIGRFLVGHFLRQGFRVVGCSRGDSDLLDPGYRHFQVDVRDEKQVARMLKEIGREYQRLDVLINNAGTASMNAALLTPLKTAEAVLQTNFLGTFSVSREAAKMMIRHRSGRIINFSSVAVPLRLEGEAVYAASKAAVEMLTRVLAREVASWGITVNAVGPSPMETEMLRGVPKRKLKAVVDQLAIKRMGTFEDVANAVDFFVRPESGGVTGQVIYLGGV